MSSFRYFRAGGLSQVRIDSGADIAALKDLDPKMWVALACPTNNLEIDPQTMSALDTDKDGRIRLPEILGAIQFAKDRFSSLDTLITAKDGLALNSLTSSGPGAAIAGTAREALRRLGKPDATSISVAEAAGAKDALAKDPFNGDGVIVEASASDAELKKVISEIVASVGGENDRSGTAGVSAAKLTAFFDELTAWDAWVKKSESDPGILQLKEKTAAAHSAMKAVKAKIDDFFARSRLASYDPRVAAAVNRNDADYAAIIAKDLSASVEEVAGFPLSKVEPGKPLPLTSGINPAWVGKMNDFLTQTVVPVLGPVTTLSEADWATLQGKLAAYDAWSSTKPASKVEALGIERVRSLLSNGCRDKLKALIDQDQARAPEFDGLADLDKLARYQRDLYRVLRNFVNFADFYDPTKPALFQAGTLFVDGRSCDLCIRVTDAGKHAALGALAKCYLLYCDCTRAGEKISIVALVSDGNAEGLMAGRNGYFIDCKGQDWDATITKIVENPISVREAFWTPYKKVIKYIEEQVAKKAATGEGDTSAKLTTSADNALATTANAGAAKAPDKPKFDLGSIALIGVAISGVAALLGTILSAVLDLGYWIPLGVISIILAISIPSMVIAALKLRQRTLGPLLDATGWAVNGRVAINIPFGKSLTHLPSNPSISGSGDKFAQSAFPWRPFLTLVGIIYLALGFWFHDLPPVPFIKNKLGIEMIAPPAVTPPAPAPAATPN